MNGWMDGYMRGFIDKILCLFIQYYTIYKCVCVCVCVCVCACACACACACVHVCVCVHDASFSIVFWFLNIYEYVLVMCLWASMYLHIGV